MSSFSKLNLIAWSLKFNQSAEVNPLKNVNTEFQVSHTSGSKFSSQLLLVVI